MPSTKIEALLDEEARNQADIDELFDGKADDLETRIAELLTNVDGRNAEIFELIGADIQDTFQDYFDIPVLERDALWNLSLSALIGAASQQAWIELFGLDAIAMFEENGRKIDTVRQKLSDAELKEAARLGIGKARINGEKERRRSLSNNREG